jgi:hypothetical protein
MRQPIARPFASGPGIVLGIVIALAVAKVTAAFLAQFAFVSATAFTAWALTAAAVVASGELGLPNARKQSGYLL